MANAAAGWETVVAVMSEAYHDGDNPRGEELLWAALSAGAPWDIVTTTAARAQQARFAARRSIEQAVPAPA